MLSLCPSPVPITCIFMCYLLLIGVGPKLMAQTASQPQPVLIVYNFAMVCMSACMFYEFIASSWLANYSLLCQPVDYSTSSVPEQMAKVRWWFYSSKVIELSDLVFFILRKKNSHLTFLHVYRHGTMIFNWWAGVKYVAGVRFLIGLINSLVHVVMYLYYWLAALGHHMQRYLWWKRYLTFLQLLHFLIVTIYTSTNLFTDCQTSTRASSPRTANRHGRNAEIPSNPPFLTRHPLSHPPSRSPNIHDSTPGTQY
nr:elongation of very long chain fatty acids protein 4-like [Oncorhynchus nerka]